MDRKIDMLSVTTDKRRQTYFSEANQHVTQYIAHKCINCRKLLSPYLQYEKYVCFARRVFVLFCYVFLNHKGLAKLG